MMYFIKLFDRIKRIIVSSKVQRKAMSSLQVMRNFVHMLTAISY